jgi:cbb3-type cytochrome oxidase subunit 3
MAIDNAITTGMNIGSIIIMVIFFVAVFWAMWAHDKHEKDKPEKM